MKKFSMKQTSRGSKTPRTQRFDTFNVKDVVSSALDELAFEDDQMIQMLQEAEAHEYEEEEMELAWVSGRTKSDRVEPMGPIPNRRVPLPPRRPFNAKKLNRMDETANKAIEFVVNRLPEDYSRSIGKCCCILMMPDIRRRAATGLRKAYLGKKALLSAVNEQMSLIKSFPLNGPTKEQVRAIIAQRRGYYTKACEFRSNRMSPGLTFSRIRRRNKRERERQEGESTPVLNARSRRAAKRALARNPQVASDLNGSRGEATEYDCYGTDTKVSVDAAVGKKGSACSCLFRRKDTRAPWAHPFCKRSDMSREDGEKYDEAKRQLAIAQFKLKSDLNGACGEATMSDDTPGGVKAEILSLTRTVESLARSLGKSNQRKQAAFIGPIQRKSKSSKKGKQNRRPTVMRLKGGGPPPERSVTGHGQAGFLAQAFADPFSVPVGSVAMTDQHSTHSTKYTAKTTVTLTPNAMGEIQLHLVAGVANDREALVWTNSTHGIAQGDLATRKTTAGVASDWSSARHNGLMNTATAVQSSVGGDYNHEHRICSMGLRVTSTGRADASSGKCYAYNASDLRDVSAKTFADIVADARTKKFNLQAGKSFTLSYAPGKSEHKEFQQNHFPWNIPGLVSYTDVVTGGVSSTAGSYASIRFTGCSPESRFEVEFVMHAEVSGGSFNSLATPNEIDVDGITHAFMLHAHMESSQANAPHVDRATHAAKLGEKAAAGVLGAGASAGVPGAGMALGVDKFLMSKKGGRFTKAAGKFMR